MLPRLGSRTSMPGMTPSTKGTQAGQPYVYPGDDAVNEGDPSGLAVQPPFYCLWWEIQCWTTELSFPNEKALQNMYMNTQLGGPWEDEYQVNLPSGWSYPIS